MTRINVYFDSRMNSTSSGFSPSAEKPGLVVDDWVAGQLCKIESFEPATFEDLCLAHDPVHVQKTLDGYSPTGFGIESAEIAESTRWTVGSMITAAIEAARSQMITCSPSSGFHHAGYSVSKNFCTFNGLVIAALRAVEDLGITRVGVLDLDWHPGDGTQEIIDRLDLTESIIHCSSGMHWPSRVSDYFDWLEQAIERLSETVELVLFQAGADAHRDDPLGGLLDDEEMRERDEMAFSLFSTHRIPIAWNLAGGYQRDSFGGIGRVIELHRQTMLEAILATQKRA